MKIENLNTCYLLINQHKINSELLKQVENKENFLYNLECRNKTLYNNLLSFVNDYLHTEQIEIEFKLGNL